MTIPVSIPPATSPGTLTGGSASVIEEYFDFLIEKDYIFFTDYPEFYPPINLGWDYPAQISNAIIDIVDFKIVQIAHILSQLDKLGCKNIQLRFYKYFDINTLSNVFSGIKKAIIDTVEIIMPYSTDIDIDKWKNFINEEYRISFIQFYNAPLYETVTHNKNGRGFIFLIEENLSSNKQCGVVSPFYFISNISAFTEAQKHNTYLNRKISIDTEGYIRNCPSMKEHYGNIKDTTLQEALEHPDFKKYWFVNKDQISVCKDCEFRYICTDCRAYLENPDDMYSKPLKCGYNPYTCEWEEWSTNPLKQTAIDHYGMREMVSKA